MNQYKFDVGEKVIILNEEFYACSGEIVKVIDCSCGIKDYEVKLTVPAYSKTEEGSRPTTVVHGKDLIPAFELSIGAFVPATKTYVSSVVEPTPVTPELTMIKSYLSEDDRMNLATEIFKRKISENFETAMKNRTDANVPFIDQVVREVANSYVDKLAPQYEDNFLTRIEKIVNDEYDPGENETKFMVWLQWQIENVCQKWINDNKDLVAGFMIDAIRETAIAVSHEKVKNVICKSVSSSVDSIIESATSKPSDESKSADDPIFYVTITHNYQYIRRGPGTDFPRVQENTLKNGNTVAIEEIVTSKDRRFWMWGRITFNHNVGRGENNEPIVKPEIGWIAITPEYNLIMPKVPK